MSTALHDPMLPQQYRVVRRWRETRDTATLALAPVDERDGVGPFVAGQFNMLYVFGVGEVPISVSGDPTRPRPLVHTVRAVGAVTQGLCALRPGDVVGVRGPFGSGWPVEEAAGSDVVLVAGGLGLAPLRPALYHLLAHRGRYGRVVLLYGARTPGDLLYRREVARWAARADLWLGVTVDRGDGGWRGHVGVVTRLIPGAAFDPADAVALVCGPEVMMRFTVAELLKRGVPEERVWLSLERNMKCAVGFCGHCQFGPAFVCKDGPVFRYDRVRALLGVREV